MGGTLGFGVFLELNDGFPNIAAYYERAQARPSYTMAGAEFLPIWKKGLTSARIRTVSVVVTSAVLVISLMAFYYRTSLLQTGPTLRRLWLMPLIGLAALILIKFFRSI